MFDRLRNYFTKESAVGHLISLMQVGRAKWTPRLYDQLAKEGYQKNVVAYRCINLIANSSARIPWVLRNRKSGEEVTNHAALTLMARPNPSIHGQVAFLSTCFGFKLIAGNSYIEAVGPRKDEVNPHSPPRELWPLRPDRMKIIPGPLGMPQGYQYEVNMRKHVWPVSPLTGRSSILHSKSFHPTDDWYGFSPIEAAAFAVDQHNEAGAWNKALLDNQARPSGALTYAPKIDGRETSASLSKQQEDKLRGEIEEMTDASRQLGRPFLFQGGLSWVEMSLSPKDMDWLRGQDVSARNVCQAFNVPPQLVGIPDQQTYANNREARLGLYEEGILPFLDEYLTDFNSWLLPMFSDNDELEFAYDMDAIPALTLRRERKFEMIQGADFLTLNEKRLEMGWEESEEENADKLIVDSSKQLLEKVGEEPEPPDDDDDNAIPPEDEDEDEKEFQKWMNANGNLTKHTDRVRKIAYGD